MTTSVGNSDDGAMFSSRPEEIETFTGQFVNLLEPKPETINLDDIAHHLSTITRYGGAAKKFYSVAEHCCLVADLMKYVPLAPPNRPLIDWAGRHAGMPYMQLAALMHDASEAYLNDMTAPAKYAMREVMPDEYYMSAYDILEDRMTEVINKLFNVTQMQRPEVKIADLWAMKIEARTLIHSGGKQWRWTGQLPMDGLLPKGVGFWGGLTSEEAEEIFKFKYEVIQETISDIINGITKEEA